MNFNEKMTCYALAGIFLLSLINFTASETSCSGTTTKIRNRYAFIADKGLISHVAHGCIDNKNHFKQLVTKSFSMETLIDLVQRLEDVIANTSSLSEFKSPDKVAGLILQRFHMDSVNFNSMEQSSHVTNVAEIDTKIIGLSKTDEFCFPDNIFSDEERCTLLFMFSHIFLNTTQENEINPNYRRRRETYKFEQNPKAQNSPYLSNDEPAKNNNNNNPQQSNVNPIQEKGIVSFRQDKSEAIAPARVLMGIIAGLTKNPVLSGSDIASKLSITLNEDIKLSDAILAVTFGNLMGSATFFEYSNEPLLDQALIYGVKGSWVNSTCCTYYAIDGVPKINVIRKSNRGSLAQIRGSLDGYIIGKSLKNIDTTNLRLSTILKSYYSTPHILGSSSLGTSYCDRSSNRPTSTELTTIGKNYNQLYKYIYSKEGSNYRGELLSPQLDQAVSTQTNFCSKRPSGTSENNSPCETPSDVIFIIDPKNEQIHNTAQLISEITSHINKIDRYAGSISVFVNSQTRLNTDSILPGGATRWPLPALIFNSTNLGSVVCNLLPDVQMSTQTLLGKFLNNVNQTILAYKWDASRRLYSGVPSKNVILVDYGSLVKANSGSDLDDFNKFKDLLKWRNRDTRIFAVSPNKDYFKDFVLESNIVAPGQTQLGASFAEKICENQATFTYNDVNASSQKSKNKTYVGYITPGYRQNWAMYPEYFRDSDNIEFKVQAIEGPLRACWDRKYPFEKQDRCKDIAQGGDFSFNINNPCGGSSIASCDAIYLTIWAKDKVGSAPCKDVRCLSLDQMKFSVEFTGAILSSSAFTLNSMLTLQAICFVLIWLRNSFAA